MLSRFEVFLLMGTRRLVHVYSAILSIVVWQRVNAQGKHPDAYAPTVEHAPVWYGHVAEVPAMPNSPPPMWTPMGSAPESLAEIPELDLKDMAKEEKAVLKPEHGVVAPSA
jgi:hypothetical protein